MSDAPVSVTLEFTPNPNTLKFVVNRQFFDRGAANFTSVEKAEHSPLAKALFEVAGVQEVMLGTHFATITKAPSGSWDVIAEKVPQTMELHLQENLPVFDENWQWESSSTEGDTEVVTRIKQVLDNEIRPAVAMDGGDIVFNRFEHGIVYLQLQGACSSCPSSVATLKMGVETRLKEVVPEIQEVVQV